MILEVCLIGTAFSIQRQVQTHSAGCMALTGIGFQRLQELLCETDELGGDSLQDFIPYDRRAGAAATDLNII